MAYGIKVAETVVRFTRGRFKTKDLMAAELDSDRTRSPVNRSDGLRGRGGRMLWRVLTKLDVFVEYRINPMFFVFFHLEVS